MLLLARLFFAAIFVIMLGSTLQASSKQAIWAIPANVTENPWFQATLKDAYFGFATFLGWVYLRERSLMSKAIWTVLVLLLGNIAMAPYVLLALKGINPKQQPDWKKQLLLGKSPA